MAWLAAIRSRLKLPRLPRIALDPKSVRAAERRLIERIRWLGKHIDIQVARCGAYVRLMRLHRPIGIWLLLWPTLWAPPAWHRNRRRSDR